MVNKKGFTLIELLVVVAIIGVLSSVGINQFNNYLASAKQKTLEVNYKNIGNSLNVEFSKCTLNNSEIVLAKHCIFYLNLRLVITNEIIEFQI